MNFMHEGGPFMWLILLTGLVALGMSVMRRSEGDVRVTVLQGALACLAFGAIGFALGMNSVMAYVGRDSTTPETKWALLVQGTAEASHNLVFGGALAVGLIIVGSVLKMRGSPAGRAREAA